MIKYTTLTEFVEEQLTKFEIPDTEKNRNKLRIKFTRTLKEIGIWDEAETKLIGRKNTKVFTFEQLEKLYSRVESYLLKHSDIDIEKLKAHRQKHEEYLAELYNMTQEDFMRQQQEKQYQPPTVTSAEAIEVMITALFEKFFEPIDKDKWNEDKATIFFTDPTDADSIDFFQASNRLSSPVTYYVKERK